VIDPVEMNEKLPVTENVKVIIVTHLHADHFDPEVVKRIMDDNPEVVVYTTEDNAEAILGAEVVRGGDAKSVGEFEMVFFGANHAPIDGDKVPCQSVGVVVNGEFVHPGDSFDMPPVENLAILGVPVSAPWLKTGEAMDYIRAVRPKVVMPIHEALWSESGMKASSNWIQRVCDEVGCEHRQLKPSEVL